MGINIFTFILAGLIVFFLSMNIILGPGWLGGAMKLSGTGTFEEVSPSLPGTLDLNKPEFRLYDDDDDDDDDAYNQNKKWTIPNSSNNKSR